MQSPVAPEHEGATHPSFTSNTDTWSTGSGLQDSGFMFPESRFQGSRVQGSGSWVQAFATHPSFTSNTDTWPRGFWVQGSWVLGSGLYQGCASHPSFTSNAATWSQGFRVKNSGFRVEEIANHPSLTTNTDTESEGRVQVSGLRVWGSALTRKGNTLKGLKDFVLKAITKIWPGWSYVCHIRSTAGVSPPPRGDSSPPLSSECGTYETVKARGYRGAQRRLREVG